MSENEFARISSGGSDFYIEERCVWAVIDIGPGSKFELSRNFLAGLMLSRALLNWANFGPFGPNPKSLVAVACVDSDDWFWCMNLQIDGRE